MKYCALLFMVFLAFPLWSQKTLDLLITNGRVVDGTGNPWYSGDVGIRKGKIYRIGDLSAYRAKRTIDANNQIVAPGFIDVHTHLERSVLDRPTADNYLYDGVTSVITGNCGRSRTDVKVFFKELKKAEPAINVGTLIGHNSVRSEVMGTANRSPTDRELEAMKQLVDRGMQEGAVGLSTGLIYVPGTYATTDEVVALAKVAANNGGIYASHIRNEGTAVAAAIEEAVNIGREASLPVQISHFKLKGKSMWQQSDMTTGMVDKFRQEGIDVTVDQYPYTASSTTLAIMLPTWALAGGTDSLNARLADPATKQRIIDGMKDILADNGYADYTFAAVARCPWNADFNGKRIPEVTTMKDRPGDLEHQIQTVLEMVAEGPRVQMIYHAMNEADVANIMQAPFSFVASDGGIPEFGNGMPHPRSYGTNARVLARYVREQGILRLEEAIRKMTSLPAQRFGLSDRGVLRPGMAADVVIFDPATITDRATFEAPHAYSEGISHVVVNGAVVIENGTYNGERPGVALKSD